MKALAHDKFILLARMQEWKQPKPSRVAYVILMKTLLNSSKFCSSNFLICLIRQISSDFSTVKVLRYTVIYIDLDYNNVIYQFILFWIYSLINPLLSLCIVFNWATSPRHELRHKFYCFINKLMCSVLSTIILFCPLTHSSRCISHTHTDNVLIMK